jgi:hypothetical protein
MGEVSAAGSFWSVSERPNADMRSRKWRAQDFVSRCVSGKTAIRAS